MKRKKYNENYFENIDSEEKVYFLGLICADGCIVNDYKNYRYRLVLKLHNKDSNILEQFTKSINWEISIWYNKKRMMCEVGLSGKKIVNDLESIGVIQNKTFHLQYPKIRQDLERHFLRGYFDGDGCVRLSLDKRDNSERGDIRIVGGSISFLEMVNERMNYLFDVNKNKLYGPKNKDYKFIGWAGMTDIEKIYDGFYEGTDLSLKRKKIIFDDVIKIINKKKKYRKK